MSIHQERDMGKLCQYYDSLTIKPYDPVYWCEHTDEKLPPIESILSLNKDVEPFVIQASALRTEFLGNDYDILQFVHLSDLHANLEAWNRMVEYVNHYKDYISFGLHTGDYCGGIQEEFHDCYVEGEPCVRPILNCVGNHDTVSGHTGKMEGPDIPHRQLFGHTENWGAVFMPGEYSMTYYRDFPESNIRLVVLNLYYDLEEQVEWLKRILDDTREKGMHLLTAMHEPSAQITDKFDVTFQSLNVTEPNDTHVFDAVIAEFKAKGGIHITNLVGHNHADNFGFTDNGVLNTIVECAADWAGWCDGKRVRGTRTYDCFNVVSVDVNRGIFKLVRVGDNADHYLRIKRTLCYDYIHGKVIFNG
ncbi:MAG: hypothetical protein IJD13_01160 [Oscillospiraceae bacterium]|nr:hypothetical protein [Oscillospiraceae bacterium]